MLKSVLNGGKALYIVPLRALASEKFRRFQEFSVLGMRVGISTGDYDRRDEGLGINDIIVATSEKQIPCSGTRLPGCRRSLLLWQMKFTLLILRQGSDA